MKVFKKAFIIFVIIFIFFIINIYLLDRTLKPIILAYCDAEARGIALETINETIRTEFKNKISYDDIITVKTDKDGNIVMIQANSVELNRIGSEISLSVQDRIRNIEGRKGSIPIGVVLKNDILANYGPKIPFKMKPVGSVNTNYRSEFQAAGINQTRHIIYLDIKASVQVIVPFARNNVSVTTSVPISESIIVGKVPETYANLDFMKDITK
ncbi:sporulation protein YunB [Caloramator proteoclasticus]|uniref:Sporulation protein YunB n=1 Tax=Caloramator proteoclasticus DSM 10124 TaxID=1121262 RepID=A0A1M4Z185_9CLOT|nr:sporulation protein YunB [Caloramator proteoclasticus]SHF11346.1 sporulation protein YunB [Caloramator proteoclasticus DSM 10124]